MKSNTELDMLLQGTGISTREESTIELLEKFKLNWKVGKQPLFLGNGTESGYYGIVREDTQNTFATCKDGYMPYQNSELIELVTRAAGQMGLSVSKGGCFKSGALVYLQIETGLLTGIGANSDGVEKYISAVNSHDGSTSLKWGMTNVTISCQNTFWAAYKQVKNSVKHTATMHARIEETIHDIEIVQEAEKTLYEKFFKLSEVPATSEHIKMVVNKALDIDLNENPDTLTGYKLNRLHDLSAAINGEMLQKGETLWGLFSGVTKYTTHKMSGGADNRAQSKAIGKGFIIDNTVFKELELVLA